MMASSSAEGVLEVDDTTSDGATDVNIWSQTVPLDAGASIPRKVVSIADTLCLEDRPSQGEYFVMLATRDHWRQSFTNI